jgi:hypothetical protein
LPLHFAGDALDIALATTVMMYAVRPLVDTAQVDRGRLADCAAAAAWLAAGTLAQPRLLPLLVGPIGLAVLDRRAVLSRLIAGTPAATPAFALLPA